MELSVLLFPLLSCVSVGLFGRFIGGKAAGKLATTFIGITFGCAVSIFYKTAVLGTVVHIKAFRWLSVGSLELSWGFLFDPVTSTMLVVVTSISFLVHLYSTSYMEYDPHLVRFMSYLSLFTFFMLCLVTGDNFGQLFLGWEGVGLSSYLLINFWFTRVQANKAAIKAIIVNRFGDFGVMMGLLALLFVFNSWNFGVIFSLIEYFNEFYIRLFCWEFHALSVCSFFLFLGCVGKSAQLGLHTWLPDAMEGPTPVSALIHAATMVTAGVFLLIRTSPLLEYSVSVLVVVTVIGSLTAFFAGTIGIFQNDLKRVIAYSTCSQLGYMVFACGLSNYSVAMFHLMNHAFFKALLFLSAGSVIHALMDEQDMRRMGGLVRLLPLTFVSFVIGSLALMGFPYTTGFYSKDVILELAYSHYYFEGLLAYWLGVLGACCTAFYSIRLIWLTFLAETNSHRVVIEKAHDSPVAMSFPLIVLGLGSVFVGYIFKDMYIGVGSSFWGNALGSYNSLNDVLLLEAEFLPFYIKMLPVALSLVSAIVAYWLYSLVPGLFYLRGSGTFKSYLRGIYQFFNQKWYFDAAYYYWVIMPVLSFGYNITFKLLDRGAIEVIGPTGLVRLFSRLSERVRKLESGFVFNYIAIMVGGIVSLLFLTQFAKTSEFVSLLWILLMFACIDLMQFRTLVFRFDQIISVDFCRKPMAMVLGLPWILRPHIKLSEEFKVQVAPVLKFITSARSAFFKLLGKKIN